MLYCVLPVVVVVMVVVWRSGSKADVEERCSNVMSALLGIERKEARKSGTVRYSLTLSV